MSNKVEVGKVNPSAVTIKVGEKATFVLMNQLLSWIAPLENDMVIDLTQKFVSWSYELPDGSQHTDLINTANIVNVVIDKYEREPTPDLNAVEDEAKRKKLSKKQMKGLN